MLIISGVGRYKKEKKKKKKERNNNRLDARKCPSRIGSTHLRVYTSLVAVVGPGVVLYKSIVLVGLLSTA